MFRSRQVQTNHKGHTSFIYMPICVQGLNKFLKFFLIKNFSPVIVLSLFLIFGKSQPGCSYKVCSYKKKACNRVTGKMSNGKKFTNNDFGGYFKFVCAFDLEFQNITTDCLKDFSCSSISDGSILKSSSPVSISFQCF